MTQTPPRHAAPRSAPRHPPLAALWRAACAPAQRASAAVGLCLGLAACGGGDDGLGSARSGVMVDEPVSASALAVAPGESVTLRARCSNGDSPMSYEWDLGDGQALQPSGSTGTFTYRYAQEGRYLPRVVCKSDNGVQAISASDAYLQVAVPTHTLTKIRVATTRSATSTEANFGADCRSAQGEPLKITWDFGDGSSDEGASVQHSYAHGSGVAQYNVSARCAAALAVKSLGGRDLPASRTVTGSTTVTVGSTTSAPEVAEPLSMAPYIATTGNPVTFKIDCTGDAAGGTLVYTYDFGDGTPLEKRFGSGEASHTYARIGNESASRYTVTATCAYDTSYGNLVQRGQTQSLQVAVRAPTLSVLAGSTIGRGSFRALTVDGHGNFYVSNTYGHAILRMDRNGAARTFAGNGEATFIDAEGLAASFDSPSGLALGADGFLYLADSGNAALRKISPSGAVTTLAGGAVRRMMDGKGASAGFDAPIAVAMGKDGFLYVAEAYAVRKVSLAGDVTTLAGGDTAGFADGSGAGAKFKRLRGLGVDGDGNILVADESVVRKISPSGVVTTLAGNPTEYGSVDGVGSAARFQPPVSLAVDAAGNAYVADYFSVRKITPSGAVTTLAGKPQPGKRDGTGAAASFAFLTGIAIGPDGTLFVTDDGLALRSITPQGKVTTVMSYEDVGSDGAGPAARFGAVAQIAAAPSGNTYVLDGNTVRKVTPAGEVSTLAGSPEGGMANGPGRQARFQSPSGITVDAKDNVFISDQGNNLVRRIAPDGTVSTFAGDGEPGVADGPANAARFQQLGPLTLDRSGNLLVSSGVNLRRIDPQGQVSTLAAGGFTQHPVSAVRFGRRLAGLASDSAGDLFVADLDAYKIYKVRTLDGSVSVHAIPGSLDVSVFAVASVATGMAIDEDDNLYVATDSGTSLQKIGPQGQVSIIQVPVSKDVLVRELSLGALALNGRRLVLVNKQSQSLLQLDPLF